MCNFSPSQISFGGGGGQKKKKKKKTGKMKESDNNVRCYMKFKFTQLTNVEQYMATCFYVSL